jgi:hypothetical protein
VAEFFVLFKVFGYFDQKALNNPATLRLVSHRRLVTIVVD